MSKKLIAIASAAALALSALVAAPASGAAVVVAFNGAAAAGTTAADPIVINVPSQNVLRHEAGTAATTSGTVVRVDVTASTTSEVVRVTATGGIKLLTTAQFTVTANRKATFGAQTLEVTSSAADGVLGFYAYTTSTAVGTITIVSGGSSIVRHIKGSNADKSYIYNLNFTAPATADVSDVITLTGNVTDVFGNKIEGLVAADTVNSGTITVTRFGSAVALATGDDAWTEDADNDGTYTFGVTTSATAGSGVIGLKSDILALTGFAKPKDTAFFSFSTSSAAEQVTALTAQVAALKSDYNALAKKYNKLVKKSKRVALK